MSMPPAWIKELGLFMTASAIVISNEAPAVVKSVTRVAKVALGNRIQICDGVNDHIEIQAALDALPATGGEVYLLEGTYNIEASLVLDSYQTLRGCGRNTILTTATANLTLLSAVGGAGTEKTGIVVADLQIDGGVGTVSDYGIHFEYVDYSLIQNVYSRRHDAYGIFLENSDFNTIEGNICQGNEDGIRLHISNNNIIIGNTCSENGYGIHLRDTCSYNTITGNVGSENNDDINLYTSSNNTITDNTGQGPGTLGIGLVISSNNNTISGNVCEGKTWQGITLNTDCNNNSIIGNTCQENGRQGIYLSTTCINNTISGNTCQGNNWAGIELNTDCDNNIVIGNICTENSQDADNTYDDIYVVDSDFNNIQSNTCRAGAQANKPRYGINISDAASDGNLVIDNDLYNDGFGTAPFNDAGTGTKLNVYVVPFVDGTDPQDSGFLIDAATEMARTWLRLPDKVVQVARMKVYARTAQGFNMPPMMADFTIYGGAYKEAYNTHDGSLVDAFFATGVAADAIIYWLLTEAGILALQGGDSVEVKVLYSAVNLATNAYFRTVEIEYV